MTSASERAARPAFSRRLRFGDPALAIASGLTVLLVLAALAIVLIDVGVNAAPKLSWRFLVANPENNMTEGGIFPAVVGMVSLVLLMTVAVVPVGVLTAVYLHEYADPRSRWTRAVRIAISNLAGVPSIVFGLFGLGFFVQFVGAGMDALFSGGQKVWAQPALLWAALTMAVLTLPVVIVATEEALRAIPREHREASLALGATKFQTVLRVVLTQAGPGILTGTILAVSRGAGEVAPILFTGAAYYLPHLPERLQDQFMHLAYHTFVLSTQSVDVDATKPLLYATVAVLLSLTFMLNLSAIVVRARMRKRQALARA